MTSNTDFEIDLQINESCLSEIGMFLIKLLGGIFGKVPSIDFPARAKLEDARCIIQKGYA